jgi:hypothetical protein
MGNGCKIQIWKDSWVMNPTTFKVISPPVLLHSDATVSELIDVDTKWWNNPLLACLFSKEEIDKIHTIPISCTNQEDTFIWRGTKNGTFSVRSAYHLQKELKNCVMASMSNSKVGSES